MQFLSILSLGLSVSLAATRGFQIDGHECLNRVYNDEDEAIVRQIMSWSFNRGDHIPGKKVAVITYNTAMWAVCNCDYGEDSYPDWEMVYAAESLDNWCGEGSSGWVWSKKENKSYWRDSTEKLENIDYQEHLCPKGCVDGGWQPKPSQGYGPGTVSAEW